MLSLSNCQPRSLQREMVFQKYLGPDVLLISFLSNRHYAYLLRSQLHRVSVMRVLAVSGI